MKQKVSRRCYLSNRYPHTQKDGLYIGTGPWVKNNDGIVTQMEYCLQNMKCSDIP